MKKELLSVSLIQADVEWENKESNLERFGRRIDEAGHTDVVILPEMFATGFNMQPELHAEGMHGSIATWMQNQADNKQALILGSVIIEEAGKFYNRLIAARPFEKLLYYDKRHLFTMAGEHLSYTPGRERLIVEWRGWNICPLVCYDLRFPVWSRNRKDYDLLVYLANWPETRREQWRMLLQARAIENQCFVAAVNRIGADGNGYQYAGDSGIINARGEWISETEPQLDVVETVEINATELDRMRQNFPFLNDADHFQIFE